MSEITTASEQVAVAGGDGVVFLDDVEGLGVDQLGAKAARLAALRAAGHPVPDGAVLTTSLLATATAEEVELAVAAVWARLGPAAVAVRSSAVAEDGADASFAGLYESVLDVEGVPAIVEAIGTVVRSASSSRVASYDDGAAGGAIAVLVQTMVPAQAAGVAFGADPVTGAREVVVISAVPGVGEALVSGGADGEDWVVDGEGARLRSGDGVALSASDAQRVADLVRAVSVGEDAPQDVEWALADGVVQLLQARPMTAVPDPVTWATEAKAPFWRRDFRLGEWLPDPVTPLFQTWFLPEQDAGFDAHVMDEFGGNMAPPFHVVSNGWIFCSIGRPSPRILGALVRHPLYMIRWSIAFQGTLKGKDIERAERWMAAPAMHAYEARGRDRHRRAVDAATAQLERAALTELPDLVDALARDFGALLYPLVECGGFAWKAEFALARFHDEHLRAHVEGNAQELLAGLRDPVAPPAHSVSTLDWSEPTLGERSGEAAAPSVERYRSLVVRREEAERSCRTALAGQPKLLSRFDAILAIAQRYAVVREEFLADMTTAWPVMRRGLLGLGAEAVRVGVVDAADDVFWLTRDEVDALLSGDDGDRRAAVVERKATWARQRRLVPPAALGEEGRSTAVFQDFADRSRTSAAGTDSLVVGVPASPGRAVGPVRVVRGPAEFELVEEGDVLVAPLTAPAWTPLFAKVAAVVTDGGSLAAHASLIAREYGIPAVVATGEATRLLRAGTEVVVDGGRGVVERA